MKFFWIDDLPQRKEAAENLASALNADYEFIDAKGKDLMHEIDKLLNKNAEPDLIVVDHKLQDIKDGLYQHGSTAAAVIRDKWLSCPIICVSGVELTDMTLDQRALYEAVFPDSAISNHYQTIDSIVKSFILFKESNPTDIEKLLVLLKVCKDDEEKIKAILPPTIKENLGKNGVVRSLSHWIRTILFERPGFLYDSIWAATFVGLKEDSFMKLNNLFDKARFDGLFADDSKPRWWKSELLNILSANISEIGLPWEKGRKLPNVIKEDFSTCQITTQPFPETVAYLDDTYKIRLPMKMKITIQDDKFQDMLYFEEIRKYNPE